MKPYTPQTASGRRKAGHDIHHKTADTTPSWRKRTAKRQKHAARQQATKDAADDGQNAIALAPPTLDSDLPKDVPGG